MSMIPRSETGPFSRMGRVLVTGASGYIGGRLVDELLERGYNVRVMVRANPETYKNRWPKAEVVIADALNVELLRSALDGIDVAYYLIHSLYLGPGEFESKDIKAADNFAATAAEKGVKRIIYLGGLGDIRTRLSHHLSNRIDVAIRLIMGKVPVTTLRAAVIIGSGSASYEMIHHLVKKMPLLLVPPWAKSKCQPVAVRDVIRYLVGVLEVPEATGQYFDIGGRDILTYEDMLKTFATVMDRKILFVPVAFNATAFFARFTSLISGKPYTLTRCLLESLQNEVVSEDESIRNILPFEPLSYVDALKEALADEDEKNGKAVRLSDLTQAPTYRVHYFILTEKRASSIFRSVCKIGGEGGWAQSNWMWRLRSALDSALSGKRAYRRENDNADLKINERSDFWRVEDIRQDSRLLLRAEMTLAGRGWLEFDIKDEVGKRRLSVTAYFDTHSIVGKIYWFTMTPFHHYVFKDLIKGIEKRS